MNNKDRRDKGLAYLADNNMIEEQMKTKKAIREYNACMPFDPDKGLECLDKAGIKHKNFLYFEPPFHCEYGNHIEVGENFYANAYCTILDVAKVKIGDNVMFGPSVSLYTAVHPIHYKARNTGYEYGIDIEIGNNVWIGGNTVVLAGVKIGDNSVIGAGSLVTKDIPPNVCAAGNPCKVIREIKEEDKLYYYKDKKFDEEVLEIIKDKLD